MKGNIKVRQMTHINRILFQEKISPPLYTNG
jgi:hypothetical protein